MKVKKINLKIKNGIKKENKEKFNNENKIKLDMLQESYDKQELRKK